MLELLNTLFRYREKKSPDKLGRFPERVDIAAMPERRYLWTSRLLVIFSAISICLTMMLASTIYVLLPQRGARPRLYNTNAFFSKLERVKPAETIVPAMDLLTESYIEKYIKLRHEVPTSQFDLLTRWALDSEFYQLSSSRVYGSFANKATYDQVAKLVERELVRRVEIDWIERLTGKLWQVQFRTLNRYGDSPEESTVIWRAYVRVDYIDIDMEKRDQWEKNPFGFKVMNYSLSYVGTPEKSEHYLETAKKVSEREVFDRD